MDPPIEKLVEMRTIFSLRRTKSGMGTYRLGSVRASVRPCVRSDFSDMAGLISFKLGTRLTCYVIHMHVHLYCDTIQYGHQAAILFQFYIVWARANT